MFCQKVIDGHDGYGTPIYRVTHGDFCDCPKGELSALASDDTLDPEFLTKRTGPAGPATES
jgi:hypothetical protein